VVKSYLKPVLATLYFSYMDLTKGKLEGQQKYMGEEKT